MKSLAAMAALAFLTSAAIPTASEAQTPSTPSEQSEAPSAPVPVPPVTAEDRRAAFPDVDGHSVHDTALNYFVLFDQLEWQSGTGRSALSWDTKGWMGGDLNRFWFRTEGDQQDGTIEGGELHALYGRAIARWWDVVAGVRQDVRPGPTRTWAAIGLQGLAPYWFEVEATAYLGSGGDVHVRVETEYELLVTNRLILQPLVEAEIFGKADPERSVGRGLSTLETGLRLRYEFRREIAPYFGITWHRKLFETADLAAGGETSETRLAVGLRLWF
jgi:copper resistance protein B